VVGALAQLTKRGGVAGVFGAHRQQIGGTVQRPGDIGYRAENLQQRAFDAVRTNDTLLSGRLQRRQTGLHQRGIRRRGEPIESPGS